VCLRRSAAGTEPYENVQNRLLHQTSGPVHAQASDEGDQRQAYFPHNRGRSSAQHKRFFPIGE